MKLRHKMLLGSSLLAVLPVLVTGALGWGLSTQLAEQSLVEQTREQLITIRSLKAQQLEEYFRLLETQARSYSQDPGLIGAFVELREAYFEEPPAAAAALRGAVERYYSDEFPRELRRRGATTLEMRPYLAGVADTRALQLQYHYIVANRSPAGFKQELNAAHDGSLFTDRHATHHPRLREQLDAASRTGGFEDLLFIDAASGRVIYSLAKNLDFATSLIDGPYADTALGQAFRRAVQAPSPDDVAFSDFQAYVPAFSAPTAFLATPVYYGTQRLGVLALAVSPERINGIMKSSEAWRSVGLRETGETYLVGPEGNLRNDSRFLVEDVEGYFSALRGMGVSGPLLERIAASGTGVLLQPVDTAAARGGSAGQSGFRRALDYRGVPVFTAYAPLSALGVNWSIISQFDETEALAPVAELRNRILIGSAALGFGVLLLGGGAGWVFTRKVTRPVHELEATVRRVAAGEDSARAQLSTGDELQTLGDAFDSLLDERIAQYERAAKENEQLNNSVIQLLMAVSELSKHDLRVRIPVTEDVTGPVSDALNLMVGEIGELLNDARSVAEQVGAASVRLQEQAHAVRQMADEEGAEVDEMAAELDAAARTMSEIAALAERCDRVAAQASETTATALETVTRTVQGMGVIRELVHETEKRIKRLGERSQEISGIVDIINTIAERTHVLALNAAMQAAAAGEAGRGFAVVADEVQRLAESSRNSTSQISALVHNIQVETSDTISTMGRTIGEVVEGSRLAERAGEQMQLTQATASELTAAVQEIASGSKEQSSTSALLREKAARVRTSTRSTREKLAEQIEQTHALVSVSGHLLDSIGAFALPERTQPATASATNAAGEAHGRLEHS
jgi:methyl-accepting chemotaxis protein